MNVVEYFCSPASNSAVSSGAILSAIWCVSFVKQQDIISSPSIMKLSLSFIRLHHQNAAWERQVDVVKSSPHYRTLDRIDGEPMEFEWNISQDSLHCSSSKKSNSSWTKWANPNNSKDELSSCRWSMASYGEVKTMKWKVLLIPHLCQRGFQCEIEG